MKRLLDETPDAFERSMLRAGSEVQPDGSAKTRLLSAIAAGTLGVAAGTGVGQAASMPWWKALFATKLGKATLIGFVAAGSGTALVVLREPALPVNVNLPAEAGSPTNSTPSVSSVARNPEVAPVVVSAPSAVVASPSVALDDPLAASPAVSPTASSSLAAPSRVNKSKRPLPTPTAVATVAPSVGPSPLVLEARLVERLRSAIRQGQTTAAEGLLAEYRQKFPDGQLRPEVNKLESQWRAH